MVLIIEICEKVRQDVDHFQAGSRSLLLLERLSEGCKGCEVTLSMASAPPFSASYGRHTAASESVEHGTIKPSLEEHALIQPER
jgi:hypothetical protein